MRSFSWVKCGVLSPGPGFFHQLDHDELHLGPLDLARGHGRDSDDIESGTDLGLVEPEGLAQHPFPSVAQDGVAEPAGDGEGEAGMGQVVLLDVDPEELRAESPAATVDGVNVLLPGESFGLAEPGVHDVDDTVRMFLAELHF